MDRPSISELGFTLIELSIVLVIIGFVVGGVLVGQDLIRAAAVRAQIAQIENFNTAVNTFQGKYEGLPGDLDATSAAQFGFVTRGQNKAEGDGNGVIEGVGFYSPEASFGACITGGETATFWVDLSTAHLIDGSFNTATETNGLPVVSSSNYSAYFPEAKISGNYIAVWSGGIQLMATGNGSLNNGRNYFLLEGFKDFPTCFPDVSLALSVQQAYAIDKKIDDGLPQLGNVMAIVDDNNTAWAGSTDLTQGPFTTANPGSSTTCFDNSSTANGMPGVAGATQHYSVGINNGVNVTCGLSFGFQ